MGHRLKLLVGGSVVAGAIGYLAILGAASSWQYYLTVDEAAADAVQLSGARMRISGRVEPGTLEISEDRRRATFMLAGVRHRMHTSCSCTLPDNLAENCEVVVEGALKNNSIIGHKLITRCASKYEPMTHVAESHHQRTQHR